MIKIDLECSVMSMPLVVFFPYYMRHGKVNSVSTAYSNATLRT